MLTPTLLDELLDRASRLRVGVLGDLFLDRYLDIDGALTEPSLETGLDAYQVVGVRSVPGAAGTVINNLVALGVGTIIPIAILGEDGEGFELGQALRALKTVRLEQVFTWPQRRTPTYTKPMLHEGEIGRELNRLDIKNRTPLPGAAERQLLEALDGVWPNLDVLLVLDQVSEPDCGVVTTTLRDRLAELGEREPHRIVLADSRERIGLFRNVHLKPNARECRTAVGASAAAPLDECIRELAERSHRPVFCTMGEEGMLIGTPGSKQVVRIPGFEVNEPTDTVGAGDSVSAALALALGTGADLQAAARLGNLAASITIRQLGTTGTASPAELRRRLRESISAPE